LGAGGAGGGDGLFGGGAKLEVAPTLILESGLIEGSGFDALLPI